MNFVNLALDKISLSAIRIVMTTKNPVQLVVQQANQAELDAAWGRCSACQREYKTETLMKQAGICGWCSRRRAVSPPQPQLPQQEEGKRG